MNSPFWSGFEKRAEEMATAAKPPAPPAPAPASVSAGGEEFTRAVQPTQITGTN